MIVTLDGQRLDGNFTSATTLAELIQSVRTDHAPGRLLTGVAVDGRALDADSIEVFLPQALTADAQIDFDSGEPVTVAAEAMRAIAVQIGVAGAAQADIATALDDGRVASGLAQLAEFIKMWQTVKTALQECATLLGQDLFTLVVGGQPLQDHLTDLVVQLTAVRDALDARDLVYLGDLVHYELPPLCQHWQTLLNDLADRMLSPSVTG